MMPHLLEVLAVLAEAAVILAVFIAPAVIWNRVVTGSWNFIDPDLRN